MRMQIIFRDAVGSIRSENAPFYSSRTLDKEDPRQVMVVLGMVEAPHGVIQGEKAVDVLLGTSRGGLSMDFSSRPYTPELFSPEESDLPGVVTELQTRSSGGFGNLLAFGTLFFRETRFPTSSGNVVCAAIGLAVVGRGTVPERVMFDLSGDGRTLRHHAAGEVPEAFEIGSALGQTFSQPIWGWDEPKRGFHSTLPLPLMDGIDRARALEAIDERSPEEERELADLMKGPVGGVIGSARRDDRFHRFRELAREMGLEPRISIPMSSYPDAEALSDMDAAASDVVRAVLDEENARYARPTMR